MIVVPVKVDWFLNLKIVIEKAVRNDLTTVFASTVLKQSTVLLSQSQF
jgi:hypothetical protein